MTCDGFWRSGSLAPMQTPRMAPTPWVTSSQPASVSNGDPQLRFTSSLFADSLPPMENIRAGPESENAMITIERRILDAGLPINQFDH